MAKEVHSKKRKASVPDAGTEQLKKPKKATSQAPKEKKRKAAEDSTAIAAKKPKKSKSAVVDEAPSSSAEDDSTLTITKTKKSANKPDAKSKKGKESKSKVDVASEDEDEVSGSSDDQDSEVDDQTVALLQGFESDGDEDDLVKEGGLGEGKKVPKVPTMTNKNKKAMKRLADSEDPQKPGIVYVGHIPHGFYEHEMRQYFEQFGSILQLRLSRNRKTGASKHYAFIQFASNIVADIVARTMDNYLLFNHILKVKLIPDEQVPENLFKGANKRFKKVPWNKIAGRKLALGASEETWEKRIEKEQTRRVEKAEKMKALGYEFDAPQIKSAKNVAKKLIEQSTEESAAISNGEETKLIEEALVVEEPKKEKKKAKKEKKPKATEEEVTQPVTDVPEKKVKKKKSKVGLTEQ